MASLNDGPPFDGSDWLDQLLSRIEEGHVLTKDLDLALEIATSMGSMPGTTICGLADGNNWAVRTIMKSTGTSSRNASSRRTCRCG